MLALSGGCLAGILINPDLDIDDPTRSHYVIGRWGMIAFGLWYLLWYLYSRLFSHRSIWSHAPVVSTVIRVGYLAAISWIILTLLRMPWPATPDWAMMAIAGLTISDMLHWAADVFITKIKHKKVGVFDRPGDRYL